MKDYQQKVSALAKTKDSIDDINSYNADDCNRILEYMNKLNSSGIQHQISSLKKKKNSFDLKTETGMSFL